MLCHTTDDFAANTLSIQASLAGKDHVAVSQQTVEIDQLQHSFDSGLKFRSKEGYHAGAETACGTGTRDRCHRAAQLRFNRMTQCNELLVQKGGHLLISSLLRGENISGSGRTVQRIINITHGREGNISKELLGFLKADPGNLIQISTHRDETAAISPSEFYAQSGGASAAAIIGATAAKAEQNFPISVLHSMTDHLPHSVRTGFAGVFPTLYLGQPGGGCHLDDSLSARQLQITGGDLLVIRTRYRHRDQLSATGFMEAGYRAFPPVCNRNLDETAAREIMGQPLLHDFDFYQTLLKNPMYTNEDVEDVVPGYQSGGYVAIIAHK